MLDIQSLVNDVQIKPRTNKRYPIKLKVSIVNDGGDFHYTGFTKDISEDGLSILYDHNVYFEENVIVLLLSL